MTSAPAYDPQNIFGKILRGELPCVKVFEDDVALAFMDIFPRVDGHTLVVPKIPARGLLDFPASALGPFMERVQRVAAAVKSGMKADGLTIQQFNESAGGQMVFHLHFHILPRHEGAPLMPPGVAGANAEIETYADKIRRAFA